MPLTVAVGPVPTSSARAWISTARETLAVLRARPELDVPTEVLDAFEGFVETWAGHAERDDETFHWVAEVDEDVVRTLGLHWARIVSVTRSGREPALEIAPPEGQAFYDALATGIVESLGAAGDPDMADALSEAVPDFDPPRHERTDDAPVRVVVVDDREDIRMLLRVWLEGDPAFEVVGEAGDGRAAIDVIAVTRPDAVVLDVEMPVMSGLDALPAITEAVPTCAVVMYSASDEEERARAAGAAAFVSKERSMRDVLDALRAAVRGQS